MRRPIKELEKDLQTMAKLLERPRTREFFADRFQIHPVTVSKWMKRLEEQGVVILRLNRGLPAEYQIYHDIE